MEPFQGPNLAHRPPVQTSVLTQSVQTNLHCPLTSWLEALVLTIRTIPNPYLIETHDIFYTAPNCQCKCFEAGHASTVYGCYSPFTI